MNQYLRKIDKTHPLRARIERGKTSRGRVLPWLVSACLGIAAVGFSGQAQACGGLFCSNSNPVNQTAERIIFARNDDNTVTAIVEIQYDGPSHEFGWLLPVPEGDVQVGVSSKQALDALQQASNPVYNLQTTFDCQGTGVNAVSGNVAAGSVAGPTTNNTTGGGPAVTVIAAGSAGPYDYVQIQVDKSLDDRAEVAIQWLEDNGFDVPDVGPDVLRPYLDEDMDLLAFRLSKGNDAGSVRPIFLTYEGQDPMIPIKPTAVAAQEDMGIMVWVLGEDRAIPKNYLHLELNEAKIDWFNPQNTYNEVVIAAADEAGGQGFVTEQSGPASDFSEAVYPQWKRDDWEENIRVGQFASIQDFLTRIRDFVQAPSSGGVAVGALSPPTFGTVEQYDGFFDVISNPDILPLRSGATPEQFNACMECYFQEDVAVQTDAYPETPYVPGEDPIEDMDVQAFLDEFERLVIKPLEDTQALFDQNQTITRFYTTLSPDEMDTDPVFDFNSKLGAVDNVHTAERVMSCDGNSWTINLPQGTQIRGSGGVWPVELNAPVPMNFRITQLGVSGDADVIEDNQDVIATGLSDLGVGGEGKVEEGKTDSAGVPIDSNSSGGSRGCSIDARLGSRHTTGWAAWSLLLFGLGLVRRRRC